MQFQFTPLHERQLAALIAYTDASNISIHASAWEATNAGVGYSNGNWFQFTPLHERQRRDSEWNKANGNFNSRLCMRGSTVWAAPIKRNSYFNSRLCMRGNGFRSGMTGLRSDFNSRLCMRGNTERMNAYAILEQFQFTPLHERQRICDRNTSVQQHISIHASAWEATFSSQLFQSQF